MCILIVADRGDLHADCLVDIARSTGTDVIRISPFDDYGEPFYFSFKDPSICIIGGRSVCFESVSGVYCRIALEQLTLGISELTALQQYSIEEETTAWMSVLLMIEGSRWINEPRHEVWADVKPFSLVQATKLGLNVPPFILTNKLDSAKSFALNRNLVVKPISDASISFQSGEYRTVPDLAPFDAPGTRSFNFETINESGVDSTPFMLQERIFRKQEYRITVIDGSLFVAKANIPEDLVDIKDAASTHYEVSELPQREGLLLVALTASLNLRLCTFDMVRSCDGQYFLVDVNPGGNWLWLDEMFGRRISAALLSSLTSQTSQ